MASLIVLIGRTENLDLTRVIPTPEYNVQDIRNYVSWVDGNYNEHRHFTDSKAQGSFKLKFPKKEDYLHFVNFIKENEDKNDCSLLCEVYCNNRDEVKRIHAFLDFEPDNELPLMADKEYEGFEVAIKERGDY